MDISATSDITYDTASMAYAESATIKNDVSCCAFDCSSLHCGFNSSTECLIQLNGGYILTDGLQPDSVSSSVHQGALTVTAPYCLNGTNNGHLTTCSSSVMCSESSRSLADKTSYSYPMSSATAEDEDSPSTMNGFCSFVPSHLLIHIATIR